MRCASGERTRRILRRDAAPATVGRRRRVPSRIGRRSSSPRFQMTLRTRRRVASDRARFSTASERSTAITRAAQRLVSIVR